ncbi:MAG: hypothetical protein RJA07_786 [Bacteroidota bacterium]|jgi:hypothetical protein
MSYLKSCTTSTLLTKNTRNYVDNFGICVEELYNKLNKESILICYKLNKIIFVKLIVVFLIYLCSINY